MEVVVWLPTMAVLILPAAVFLGTFVPHLSRVERLVGGAALAFAVLVLVAFAAAHVALGLTLPAMGVLAAAALIAGWRRRRTPSRARPETTSPDPVAGLLVVLGLVAASRFGVTLVHDLPPGWDPSFHLILARKVLETGGLVKDWRPFEEVTLNYPLGSHLVVAVMAQATGLPLHVVFKLLIPTIGVLTTAQAYVFAKRTTRSVEVGLFAALAYGAWALFGSIDYYRWGGLPNALGMALAYEALSQLAAPHRDWRTAVLFAGSLAAAMIVHHHVMLTAGAMFLVLLVVLARAEPERARWLLGALLGAGLLAAAHIVPYAQRVTALGETQVLTFTEEVLTPWRFVVVLGPVLVLGALGGAAVAWHARDDTAWRVDRVVPVALLTLVVLYLIFGHAWLFVSRWTAGTGSVAFTPSRFATDLAYLLPVYAGIGVAWLARRVRAPRWAVLFVGLGLGLVNLPAWQELAVPIVIGPDWRAYRWIDEHLPAETIVLNHSQWATYASWRRSARTPLPASEPSPEGTAKHLLIRSLEAGVVPPEARDVPVVGVCTINLARSRRWRVIWQGPPDVAVVAFHPGSLDSAGARTP